MRLLFIALLLTILKFSESTDFNITKLHENTTIYSEEIGEAFFHTNYWKIITNIDLTNYQDDLNEIKTEFQKLKKLCQNIIRKTGIDHCNKFEADIRTIESILTFAACYIETLGNLARHQE